MIDLNLYQIREEIRVTLALSVGAPIVIIVVVFWMVQDGFPQDWLYSTDPIPQLQVHPHGDGQVILSWSEATTLNTPLDNWQYQRGSDNLEYSDWEDSPIETTGNNYTVESLNNEWIHTYIVSGLENGWTYTFRIKSDSEGYDNRMMSNEASVTLPVKSYQIENIEKNLRKANNSLSEILQAMTGSHIVPQFDLILMHVEVNTNFLLNMECAPNANCQCIQLGELYFDHDSYSLDIEDEQCDCGNGNSNQATLQDIIETLEKRQGIVKVEGYASYPGTVSYNLDLSKKRAEHVIEHLLDNLGDHRERFYAIAKGEIYTGSAYCDEACSRKAQVFLCQD